MNSKGHLYISLTKSGIRIVGGITAILCKSMGVLALSIVLAEGLGILEELFDKR